MILVLLRLSSHNLEMCQSRQKMALPNKTHIHTCAEVEKDEDGY